MRIPAAAIVCSTLLSAQAAWAHHQDCAPYFSGSSGCGAPVHFSARHDPSDARIAITTTDGDVTLLLTDDVVAFQLSNRALHRVDRKLDDCRDEDNDNVIAQAIKTAVLSTVRSVLDHSAECSVYDLRDVTYEDGHLEFRTTRGRRVFDHLDVDDRDVVGEFSERDARAFVHEFRTLRGR